MTDPFLVCSDSLRGARVLAFCCEQRLVQPYQVQVYLDADFDLTNPEAVLGEPVTLLVNERPVHGRVFGVELKLAVEHRHIYRVTLGPPLQRLAYSRHSRVYPQRSMVEVIEATLARNQIADYEFRLSNSYPTRPHIVQYKESDLAFLHRWMEREGVYYYHLQTDAGATLVITDDTAAQDSADNGVVRYYSGGRGDWEEMEALDRWQRARRAGAAGAQLGDYDFLKPALEIASTARSNTPGFEELVRYEDNLQDPAEAKRLAALRLEEQTASSLLWRGRGNVRGLHEGLCFTLGEHPRESFNRRYQVVAATHRGTVLRGDPILAQIGLPDMKSAYEVSVEALPDDVQFRPARNTPWPHIAGVESAIVDGPVDTEYAPVDEHGRYRVRFHFDEAKERDGAVSAWFRMLQPHGGPTEGYHFPLRKGTEALVAFVQGDPDRPYIAGAVPTPREPSPVTLRNATQNVVQTGGRNRVEIEDLEGQQYIDVLAPEQRSFLHLGVHAGLGDHHLVLSTTGDGLHHAGDQRDLSVRGNQSETVVGNVVEDYSSNQTTHVVGSFEEQVNSGMTQSVSLGASQSVDGGLRQTIDGGETRTVNGDLAETIEGGRTQTINGSSMETVGGDLSQAVSGSVAISTADTYSVNASSSVSITTPAAGSIAALGGVRIVAPGGHMSVDKWYKGVGVVDAIDHFYKWGGAPRKVTFNGIWLRQIGIHLAGYGLKVDLKALDIKDKARANESGALKVDADANKNMAAGLHMIDSAAVVAAVLTPKYWIAGAMGLGMLASVAAPVVLGDNKGGGGGDSDGDSGGNDGVRGAGEGECVDLGPVHAEGEQVRSSEQIAGLSCGEPGTCSPSSPQSPPQRLSEQQNESQQYPSALPLRDSANNDRRSSSSPKDAFDEQQPSPEWNRSAVEDDGSDNG